MRRAFKEAGVSVRQDVLNALGNVTAARSSTDYVEWCSAVNTLNKIAAEQAVSLRLLPLDLEEAALMNASESTIRAIVEKVGLQGESAARICSPPLDPRLTTPIVFGKARGSEVILVKHYLQAKYQYR